MRLGSLFSTSLLISVGFLISSQATLANNIYIAQTSVGAANGSSCANANAVTFFNSSGNWGSGASQIGPGTTIHLCGAITTGLQILGSGTSSNVIEVLWEKGARISVPYGQIVNLNGNSGYLLFDGGIACGPGTSCDTIEAANQTGYATGQTGIIEATANGSGLANQNINTQAFYGCNGCHDIEIRNLIVRNLYIHSSASDATGSADTGNFAFQCAEGNSGCAPGAISIHDSTIHDNGNAISLERTSSVTFNVFNIDFYHNNWAMENSGNGTRTVNFHDNHIHDAANWDTSSDTFHHNGVHSYMNVPSDSLAINLYNNLSDGNWGSCCTTTTQLFVEVSSPDNFNVYNNVAIQHPGNTAPAWQYAATNGVFANNTAIGSVTSGNVEAIELYGTGIAFENNTVTGYGQFVYVYAGTTFTSFDHNQWGTVGGNGNSPWQWMSTGANTFLAWQTACSCDAHSGNPASLGLSSTGVPQAGSALIGAGVNLANLGMAVLGSTTSAGDTVAPQSRPASGAWVVGAYGYLAAPSLNPPTALTASAH